ncbi:MAG: hypothetical protein R3B35_10700 [Gemmatimonadales bacterium]
MTVGGRHYRPFFNLWTIRGAFCARPTRLRHGAVDVTPMPSVTLHARERYRFEDTETATPTVDVEDRGRRYTTGSAGGPRPAGRSMPGTRLRVRARAAALEGDYRVTFLLTDASRFARTPRGLRRARWNSASTTPR